MDWGEKSVCVCVGGGGMCMREDILNTIFYSGVVAVDTDGA